MSPLTIASSTEAGRYYVAARDIALGDAVLYASPEAWAPLWPCDLSELSPRELAVMRADAGPNPPPGEPSSEAEEDLKEFVGSISLYWLLAVRACLLVQDDPASLAALKRLEDHAAARPAAQQQMLVSCSHRLSRALHLGASVQLEPAGVCHVLGTLLVNAFGTRSGLFGSAASGEADGAGIFAAAALFNHSCKPACYADLSLRPRAGGKSGEGGAIRFVACRPIGAGEVVSISYLDTSEPTHVRQRLLRRTKHFTCACELCADADEGGRRGSHLRCARCADGWQRPSPPPPARPSAWACARCGSRTDGAQLWALEAGLRRRLRAACAADDEAAPPAVEAALLRLERDALARLHPQHALVLQARLARVAHCLRGAAADAADAARRIAAAEAALEVARALLEPLDPQKADLLFQLAAWRHALGAFAAPGSEAALAAFHAGGAAALESAQQFGLVCGKEEAPTRAARELAALCMKSLKAARAAAAR